MDNRISKRIPAAQKAKLASLSESPTTIVEAPFYQWLNKHPTIRLIFVALCVLVPTVYVPIEIWTSFKPTQRLFDAAQQFYYDRYWNPNIDTNTFSVLFVPSSNDENYWRSTKAEKLLDDYVSHSGAQIIRAPRGLKISNASNKATEFKGRRRAAADLATIHNVDVVVWPTEKSEASAVEVVLNPKYLTYDGAPRSPDEYERLNLEKLFSAGNNNLIQRLLIAQSKSGVKTDVVLSRLEALLKAENKSVSKDHLMWAIYGYLKTMVAQNTDNFIAANDGIEALKKALTILAGQPEHNDTQLAIRILLTDALIAHSGRTGRKHLALEALQSIDLLVEESKNKFNFSFNSRLHLLRGNALHALASETNEKSEATEIYSRALYEIQEAKKLQINASRLYWVKARLDNASLLLDFAVFQGHSELFELYGAMAFCDLEEAEAQIYEGDGEMQADLLKLLKVKALIYIGLGGRLAETDRSNRLDLVEGSCKQRSVKLGKFGDSGLGVKLFSKMLGVEAYDEGVRLLKERILKANVNGLWRNLAHLHLLLANSTAEKAYITNNGDGIAEGLNAANAALLLAQKHGTSRQIEAIKLTINALRNFRPTSQN
jgi:hypothetical protein